MNKLFNINLFKERRMRVQEEIRPLIRNQYGIFRPKAGAYIIKYYVYSGLGEAIYNSFDKKEL